MFLEQSLIVEPITFFWAAFRGIYEQCGRMQCLQRLWHPVHADMVGQVGTLPVAEKRKGMP